MRATQDRAGPVPPRRRIPLKRAGQRQRQLAHVLVQQDSKSEESAAGRAREASLRNCAVLDLSRLDTELPRLAPRICFEIDHTPFRLAAMARADTARGQRGSISRCFRVGPAGFCGSGNCGWLWGTSAKDPLCAVLTVETEK